MHEIISLQLGQSSNYVATHFWNAQESYFTYGDYPSDLAVDSDIHWRAGLGADGAETFLPRTVIYDLKGGFGTLRKINALYETPDERQSGVAEASMTWSAKPVVHQLPSIPQNRYQQSLDAGSTTPGLLSSDVRYWSDFSRVFYHPKSLSQLYDYELNSSIRPFEDWHLGQELFQSIDREEDMVDRDFRPFIEEADQMQGIQVFTCLDDAWGGFAAEYIDRMRDEYPKTTIWVWGVQTPRLPRARLPNLARSLARMCEQTSMVVPMSMPDEKRLPPNIRLNPQSQWHTSALLSTALETAGFRSRIAPSGRRETLGDIAARLNLSGKQTMSRLQMSVFQAWPPGDAKKTSAPAPSPGYVPDIDLFRLTSTYKMPTLSPKRDFGQVWDLRTTLPHAQNGESDEARCPDHGLPAACVHCMVHNTQFPLLDSFPVIYLDNDGSSLPGSVGVATRLSTDTAISGPVKELTSLAGPFIAIDEREDLSNTLVELADSYRDGWSSGSDDEDD